MGTNYYTTKKQTHCETCGQKLPKVDVVYDVHLGKSSYGWAFTWGVFIGFGSFLAIGNAIDFLLKR